MPLVVEDGTGRADAESLCSAAAADTYHVNRGNAAWAALDATGKEQALRKATDFMSVYRNRWAGYRKTTLQALDWPRFSVPIKDAGYGGYWAYYDSESVPLAVQNACAELALKSLTTTLAPDLKPPRTRVKVGPIETEFARGDRQTTTFRAVEAMLLPYFGAGGGLNVKVTRA